MLSQTLFTVAKDWKTETKFGFDVNFKCGSKLNAATFTWLSLTMLWHAITSASSPKLCHNLRRIFFRFQNGKSTIITLKIERETKAKHVWLINHPHRDGSNYESIFLVVCSLWCATHTHTHYTAMRTNRRCVVSAHFVINEIDMYGTIFQP